MSVNDLVVQGAEPLFFLDYFACGKLEPDIGAPMWSRASRTAAARPTAPLIGGETAEMPGLYQAGDYDLAGFAVGAAERGTLLPRPDIAAGDVVIGLASSGVHSNGYSLVRRVVEKSGLGWDAPAPFDRTRSLGEALLDADPHLRRLVPRGDPRDARRQGARPHHRRRLSRQYPPRPARRASASNSTSRAFRCCRYSAGWRKPATSPNAEMLRTFNCGIGMIAVVAPAEADAVMAAFARAGESVVRLGEVTVARRRARRIYGRARADGLTRWPASAPPS